MPPSPRFARLAENPIAGNADEYDISAVFNACREAAADASLACMRARNRLGIAIAAMIRIIAAIANPNLLRARMQANEASAAASLHALNTAKISYSSAFPAIGFSANLANLGDGGISPCPGSATASCYIDQNLASGTKSGYIFSYTQDASSTPSLHYSVNVDPLSRGISGQGSFYSSDTNVTRYNTNGTAGSSDAPIQ